MWNHIWTFCSPSNLFNKTWSTLRDVQKHLFCRVGGVVIQGTEFQMSRFPNKQFPHNHNFSTFTENYLFHSWAFSKIKCPSSKKLWIPWTDFWYNGFPSLPLSAKQLSFEKTKLKKKKKGSAYSWRILSRRIQVLRRDNGINDLNISLSVDSSDCYSTNNQNFCLLKITGKKTNLISILW